MERNEKKSSATAKTALGLAIGGLSLAALQGGAFGGNSCGCNGGNRGILGGLFGGNDGACQVYNQKKMDEGQAAVTELTMVDKYVMPMWNSVCELQTKVAVSDEREKKNEVINGLLFKMADQHANNLFERAQCCCEKNQIAIANAYDRLAAQDQCNYDKLAAAQKCCCDRLEALDACNYERLDSKIDCVSDKATMRTDATFALRKAQVDAQIAENMCGVIKGKPYLSPNQMADPYMASRNVLVSRQYSPTSCASNYCGYNDGCWGSWGNWSW